MSSNIDLFDFEISYHSSDVLREPKCFNDPSDFVKEISIIIEHVEYPKRTLIGKGKVNHILFFFFMDADFPLMDLVDATQPVLDMSEVLFNLNPEEDFYEKIQSHFEKDPPMNYNVCYLDRLEVLPAYRGKGLSGRIIANIAQHFYDSCGLMVLKAYPLQHELDILDHSSLDEWDVAMQYDALHKDLERSQYQLYNHYQKMGFSNPFDLEYFIAKPDCLAFQ